MPEWTNLKWIQGAGTMAPTGAAILTDSSWWRMAGPLAGVVLGFALAQLKDLWAGHRRRRAHSRALQAEVKFCRDRANTYLTCKVKSPSYRLPVMAYNNSLPQLLGDGALKDHQVKGLIDFFTEVDALIRGLDQINGYRGTETTKQFEDEYRRNLIKAQNILNKYQAACDALT